MATTSRSQAEPLVLPLDALVVMVPAPTYAALAMGGTPDTTSTFRSASILPLHTVSVVPLMDYTAASACFFTFSTMSGAAFKASRTSASTVTPFRRLIDELGYLPMDKRGADLLFQVISARYERSATVLTTNMVYKHWARIFNNDATLTTAILDRLVHHCETVTIEGKSYRSQKDPE